MRGTPATSRKPRGPAAYDPAGVSVTLELRHLWTLTGGPLEWTFEGEDERELCDLMRYLDEHRADARRRSAVLIARTGEGKLIGAWNRSGAAVLADVIGRIPRDREWMDVRSALLYAVSGP